MSAVIRNPGAVYRSTDPAHLQIVRANEATRAAADGIAQAVADELVPGSSAYGVVYDDNGFAVTGLQVHADLTEVPTGLRWDTKHPSDRERVESDPSWTPIPLSEFYAARESVA